MSKEFELLDENNFELEESCTLDEDDPDVVNLKLTNELEYQLILANSKIFDGTAETPQSPTICENNRLSSEPVSVSVPDETANPDATPQSSTSNMSSKTSSANTTPSPINSRIPICHKIQSTRGQDLVNGVKEKLLQYTSTPGEDISSTATTANSLSRDDGALTYRYNKC